MSKAGASGPASAMGGLPRQRCCAFKDQHDVGAEAAS